MCYTFLYGRIRRQSLHLSSGPSLKVLEQSPDASYCFNYILYISCLAAGGCQHTNIIINQSGQARLGG